MSPLSTACPFHSANIKNARTRLRAPSHAIILGMNASPAPAPKRPIRRLPADLVSQIAAGEVVERPASVVKELIENALDAGARRIEVRIEQAGRRLIEVRDDGHGIPAEQLPLAVQRHATSKIASADDLFHILSLGFRGEALAAIGSVSRLTLASRPPDAAVGARLRVEGGHIVAGPEPVALPPGTQVQVEDLFYNVPARRKFLKKPATERRAIDEVVLRYALAYPQVRFKLVHDRRVALHTPGSGDQREVLAARYGPAETRQMLPVLSEDLGIRVTGFIGPPGLNRSHRRDILFFVNGRPVRDAALTSALLKGYENALMKGRYPVAVLFLQLPPEAVDVNVHPTKAEVRFREPDRVFRAVVRAVRKALLAHAPLARTAAPLSQWDLAASDPTAPEPMPWSGPPPEEDSPAPAPTEPPEAAPSSTAEADAAPLPGIGQPVLRLIGQVAATYLVAEGPDGLYLIDQHAAHERVLFEQMLARAATESAAQTLLEPVTVTLPLPQAEMVEAQREILQRIGFTIEPFGRGMFRVRAVPAALAGRDVAQALRAAVEDISHDETPLAHDAEARLVARICKALAVKGGQRLSPQEQARLLQDLLACENPRTCPHGRPTMIRIPVERLEREFGRHGPR